MKIYLVTLCHNPIEQIEATLTNLHRTADGIWDEHILVDHHWPKDSWRHSERLLALAQVYGCKLMRPYKNLGGHGGYNWVLDQIGFTEEDFFLAFDGDSMPETNGWDSALARAMMEPNTALVTLMPKEKENSHNWVSGNLSEPRIVKPAGNRIEMFNVGLWQGKFLRNHGFGSTRTKFWGFVEHSMIPVIWSLGLQYWYLRDFKETLIPCPDPDYRKWKELHASGDFPGNFDEFLKR